MVEAAKGIDELRSYVGIESAPVTYDIEKGAIAKFARAVGDQSPLYANEFVAKKSSFGEIIAPPTFLRSLIPGRYPKPLPNPYSYVLDGGSEYSFCSPIRAGDRITVVRRVADIFEKDGRLGKMLFIVTEIRYTNQHGEVAAIQKSTTICYGTGERDAAIDDL